METSLFQFHHPLGRFPPLKPPFGATGGGETTEVRGTGSVDRPGQAPPTDRRTDGWTATRIEQIVTRITAGWLPPSFRRASRSCSINSCSFSGFLVAFSRTSSSLFTSSGSGFMPATEPTNRSHLVPSLPFPMSVETTPILSNISKFSEGVEGRWKE